MSDETKNYEDIIGVMRALRLADLERSFGRAIADEACALADNGTRSSPKAAVDAARELYGHEVVTELHRPGKLTADDVLGLRRRPVAWAVARKLREAGAVARLVDGQLRVATQAKTEDSHKHIPSPSAGGRCSHPECGGSLLENLPRKERS